ncbi:hypothetical protein BMJ21_29375 [Sinorhizobium medicae]|nr:hypothetical protein BMJ21_29375 [Sinorhizobium medicae]
MSLINLPDVFNRVQYRRTRRQEQQSNVVRDAELRRDVPSGLVEDEDHASAVIDCLGLHFQQMLIHAIGVAPGQYEGRARPHRPLNQTALKVGYRGEPIGG